MPPTPTLPPWRASARLRLREFEAADVDAIARMHSDARVRAQLIDDYPLQDPAAAALFVDRMRALYARHPGLGIWCAERSVPPDPEALRQARAAVAREELPEASLAFLEQPTWRFCGWFNLMPVPHAPHEVEIGARLTPDAWGSGLGLDGCEWLLQHAFEGLRCAQVFAYCSPDNRSAIHALQVLGLEPRERCAYDGQPADKFVITRERWQGWRSLSRRQRQRQVRDGSRALA